MNIIFVRHGETKEGKKGIILGSLNGNLTTKGKQEAREIVRGLTEKKTIPNIIISSPLKRALDTAHIISKALKIPATTDPLIRERAAGGAERKTESQINWDAYEQKPLVHRKHVGGESFLDVYKRAEKFIKKIKKSPSNQIILVVSHSVFILMCIAILKQTSIEYILKHRPKSSIIVFKK